LFSQQNDIICYDANLRKRNNLHCWQCDNYNVKQYMQMVQHVLYAFFWLRRTCDYI